MSKIEQLIRGKQKGDKEKRLRSSSVKIVGELPKEIERCRIHAEVKKSDLCDYIGISIWSYNQFLRGNAGMTSKRLDLAFKRLQVSPILVDDFDSEGARKSLLAAVGRLKDIGLM